MGGDATPPEEYTDIMGLTPERAHLLLHIKTTGRTWMGEYQTTLHRSVAGAGSLHNQRAGTPHPLERWGAASR